MFLFNANASADVTIDFKNATIDASGCSFNNKASVLGVHGFKGKLTIKNLKIKGAAGVDDTNVKHCLNVFDSSNVVLENVELADSATAGMVVNGSNVVASALKASGNVWGSVNVDQTTSVPVGAQTSFKLEGENGLEDDVQIWTEKPDQCKVTADGYTKVVGGNESDGILKGYTYYSNDLKKLGSASADLEGEGDVPRVFATLPEAVGYVAASNAKSGTAALLKNERAGGVGLFNKDRHDGLKLTIDLGGNTYTLADPAVGSTGTESQGFHFEKGNEVTVQNGNIAVDESSVETQMVFQNYCNLTLKNLDVVGSSSSRYLISSNYGDTVLQDVSLSGSAKDLVAIDLMHWHNESYRDKAPTLTINNSSQKVINGSIDVYCYENEVIEDCESPSQLKINGGTFQTKKDILNFVEKGNVVRIVENGFEVLKKQNLTEGTYKVPSGETIAASDLAANMSVSQAEDGTWVVTKLVVPPSGGGGGSTSGDKTEVEQNQDGSTTTTVTKPDGSQTITHETATGTESVVKKDEDGNVTSTEVTVSKKDAESGKVELPIEKSEPAAEADKAPAVEVKVPATVTAERPVQVTVPVAKGEGSEPNYGVVVFAVDEDGNETVIPKTAVDDDGNVVFEATGDVTIKVVDAAKDMPDVDESDWFAGDVVAFATARGIVNGVDAPDGTKEFQGYGGTSRGMLVAMLHNLELNPEAASEESLADVPSGAFYADAAAWALEEGILSGVDTPDGTKQFQGESAVTREQVAVFLMRYAGYLGMDVSKRAEIGFPDASEVSGFAKDAMSWAVAEGLFKGNDVTGELNPTDGAARAEVAAVLMRFINLMYA